MRVCECVLVRFDCVRANDSCIYALLFIFLRVCAVRACVVLICVRCVQMIVALNALLFHLPIGLSWSSHEDTLGEI